METSKLLDLKFSQLDQKQFIAHDPIQIPIAMLNRPHATVQDVEICAMWTAMISWGRRNMILKAANTLMDRCEWHPYDFIKSGEFFSIGKNETIYRTLKGKDFINVCNNMFTLYQGDISIQQILQNNPYTTTEDLIQLLCDLLAPARIGHPNKNSACKRINMLIRWMVRHDKIDLGIWKAQKITPATLYAIIDTHVAQQAQKMGLISNPKESWKAVEELTTVYRSWDPIDPLKYDFVLMTENLK